MAYDVTFVFRKVTSYTAVTWTVALIVCLNMNLSNTNQVAFGDKNNEDDYCDEYNLDDAKHGDNSPSESSFIQLIKDTTICEVAQAIDDMRADGQIREDTKYDWDWFVKQTAFENSSDGQKMCMKERYDLPDDGDKQLAAYEVQHCASGKYQF